MDSVFIFKFHPYTKTPDISRVQYSNLLFIEPEMNVYPWINQIDVLITDYSSIYYEFMLLGEKEAILFPFDEEIYKRDKRGLFFDYEINMPCKRVYSFSELLENLVIEQCHKVPEREDIIKKFWNYDTPLDMLLEKHDYHLSKMPNMINNKQ